MRVCDPPHTPQTQTPKRCPQVSALLGRIPSAVGYQPTLATDLGLLQERITTNQKGSITSVQVPSLPPPSPLSIYLSFVAPRSEPETPLSSDIPWARNPNPGRCTNPSRARLPVSFSPCFSLPPPPAPSLYHSCSMSTPSSVLAACEVNYWD